MSRDLWLVIGLRCIKQEVFGRAPSKSSESQSKPLTGQSGGGAAAARQPK